MAQRNARAKEPEKSKNKELPVIIAGAVALLLELCFFHVLGTVGGWIRYAFFGLFGLAAYVLPVFALAVLIYLTYSREKRKGKVVCGVIFYLCLCAFLHMVSIKGFESLSAGDCFRTCAEQGTGGGLAGGLLALGLSRAVSTVGAYVVTILAAIVCLLILCEVHLISLVKDAFSTRQYDVYDDDLYEDEEPDKVVRPSGRKQPERAFPTRVEREPLPDWEEEYEYEPRRARAGRDEESEYESRRTRAKQEDDLLYEMQSEEGVTIRIVNGRRRKRRPRMELKRSANKALPLRTDDVETVRTLRKGRGIAEGIFEDPNRRNIDEVREITEKPDAVQDVQPEKKPARPSGVLMPTITPEAAPEEAVPEKTVPEQTAPEKPKRRREKKPASRITTETQIAPPKPPEKPKPKKAEPSKAEKAVPAVLPSDMKKSGDYIYPPVSLLTQRKGKSKGTNEAELDQMAQNLEVILSNFGVAARVVDRQVGPTVTRFELQPEMGTRVSKITSLVDDLKLNLAVSDIRIEAPIPGRAAIGIEIPNETKDTVLIRELIEAPELINHKSKIAFAAGVDISGNVVVADIAKMPHLLVAGTTGSGKSVFMNSIIMSILFRAKPSEVGLIIIDPKKIEFGVYSGIPHLVKDVVTDPGQAVGTLRWAVNEMTNRYQRMQLSGVRDFKSYNEKFDKGTLNSEEENPKRMPQIVILIDELADLMMVASKEAEALICRLAQLARAAGIHLIIATQRPSVDVVTGLIKANIPGRVALLVASQVDSRTIIDMKGAEELLGYGDMLFYPTGYTKPLRVQGAFVSDDEVANVVSFLKQNKTEDYFAEEAAQMAEYMSSTQETQGADSGSDASGGSGLDEYLFEAGKLCIEMGKASSSMLQRHFSVGFNRAARIIDQLTEMGAVGPANGAKPREILVDLYTFEEMFQSKEE